MGFYAMRLRLPCLDLVYAEGCRESRKTAPPRRESLPPLGSAGPKLARIPQGCANTDTDIPSVRREGETNVGI
jgi:hypothetical protein